MSAVRATISRLQNTALITDDVASGSIRHLAADQKASKPYILVDGDIENPNDTTTGQDLDKYQVTVIIVSSLLSTYSGTIGALNIADNVRNTLHDYKGTFDGVVVQGAKFERQQTMPPIRTGDDQREYEVHQTYSVWTQPSSAITVGTSVAAVSLTSVQFAGISADPSTYYLDSASVEPGEFTTETSDDANLVTALTYANDGQIVNESTGFTTMSPTTTPSGATGTYTMDAVTGLSINSSTGDITANLSTLATGTIHTPTVTFTANGIYSGSPTYKISVMAFTQPILVKIGDETSDLETGERIAHIRAPFDGTIASVVFSCDKSNVPTGSITTFDVNVEGTSIFSTNPTVDAGESTTDTAATAAVISDGAVTEGEEITIDCDGVGSTTTGYAWMATINITAS